MNTNTRGPKMDQSFVMRVSNEDKAALKLAAVERGMSVSALIRDVLISQKILPPVWTHSDENF